MCHSRTINNKINSLHERCLRIIYNGYRSSFEYLLDRDKGVTIHLKNVRTLAIEMSLRSLKNEIMFMTLEILLNLLDLEYEVFSMVKRVFPILDLKSRI